jgi:hypothetical protein
MSAMVCISLRLAEKLSTAGVLDDQEVRAAGSAHGEAEHGAVGAELLSDAVGFGEGVAIKCNWMVSSDTPSQGGRRCP